MAWKMLTENGNTHETTCPGLVDLAELAAYARGYTNLAANGNSSLSPGAVYLQVSCDCL